MNRKRYVRMAGMLVFVLLCSIACLLFDGFHDELVVSDVAIVLGNAVSNTGKPGTALQARLDKTIDLYRAGFFPNIFVSGAVGKEGYDEALVMKEYLVSYGIPKEVIWVDSLGDTTYKTAWHAACIMKQRGITKAIVISQYFHLSRSRLALSRFGVSHIAKAHASLFLAKDPYSIAREWVGYVYYFFRKYPKDPC